MNAPVSNKALGYIIMNKNKVDGSKELKIRQIHNHKFETFSSSQGSMGPRRFGDIMGFFK